MKETVQYYIDSTTAAWIEIELTVRQVVWILDWQHEFSSFALESFWFTRPFFVVARGLFLFWN